MSPVRPELEPVDPQARANSRIAELTRRVDALERSHLTGPQRAYAETLPETIVTTNVAGPSVDIYVPSTQSVVLVAGQIDFKMTTGSGVCVMWVTEPIDLIGGGITLAGGTSQTYLTLKTWAQSYYTVSGELIEPQVIPSMAMIVNPTVGERTYTLNAGTGTGGPLYLRNRKLWVVVI